MTNSDFDNWVRSESRRQKMRAFWNWVQDWAWFAALTALAVISVLAYLGGAR